MSRALEAEVAGLASLRAELEELPGWPFTPVAVGLMLYDVVLALGLDEGRCAEVLGPAWPSVAACVGGYAGEWDLVGLGGGRGRASGPWP